MFEISTLKFEKLQMQMQKKTLSWGPKLHYLGVLWNLKKSIVMLEISTLEFVELQSFIQNKKTLILGPRMSSLGTFRPEF